MAAVPTDAVAAVPTDAVASDPEDLREDLEFEIIALRQEDEAAPERFPGRVSHSQSRQTAARWAEICGHWAPEDQHALILRINRRRMVLKLFKFIGLGAPRAWLP